MANMIGHSGYYPCFYCYIKGEHIRAARKRQYQYEPPVPLRAVNSFYHNLNKAKLDNKNVFGHLGVSILAEVVDVHLPHALIIDYAHVSLLRHFGDIIITITSSLASSVRRKIDYSLRAQVFPHFCQRKMRGIEDLSFIKAIEWKNLLLYGFIPHFMPYLTIDQLCLISLFIIGIRLIHEDNIFIPTTNATANNLLNKYYADLHMYFTFHANFALHLHQHLHEVYEFHGPLSSINTFSQEDFIGYVRKNKNGTTSFENLFAYYYNIDFFLKRFNDKSTRTANGKIYLLVFALDKLAK